MTTAAFIIGMLIYVGSAAIYARAAAMTATPFGRALSAIQTVLAIALAAAAFEDRREAAWLWLAYAVIVAVSRKRAVALSARNGVAVTGLAQPFVKLRGDEIPSDGAA